MRALLNGRKLDRGSLNSSILFATALLVAVAMATRTRADVVADFDDGNTAAAVDGYVGMPGDGWASAWIEDIHSVSPDTTTTNTVLGSGGPISGGGNYLSAVVTPASDDEGNARYALGRNFSAGIDQTSPYRIEFTLRIDEDVDSNSTTFTDYHDRYSIYDSILGNQNATNNNNSWSIFSHGGTGAQAHAGAVGQWAFYSGANDDSFDGSDPLKMISTGIALTTGGVYEFTIDVFPNADPALGTWSATVDDGTDAFTKTDMGYRANDGVKEYLYFSTKKSAGVPGSSTDDVRAFSVDGIRISNITPVTLYVNRETGAITIKNTGTEDLPIRGYSITSESGALNADPGNWKSIANNYDSDSGGSFDNNDTWTILSVQNAGHTDLSEFEFGGDGGILGVGNSILLSQPAGIGAWIPTPDQDLMAEIALADENNTILSVPILYEGAGGLLLRSDLNHDGFITSADWDIFRTNRPAYLPALSVAQTYVLGDLDGNKYINTDDFALFRFDYNAANGAGAFSAMIQGVPEPSSLVLLGLSGFGTLWFRRARRPKYSLQCSGSLRRAVNCSCVLVTSLLAIMAVASRTEADVVADFDDGNTAAAVDGYVGMPGDGWASEWIENFDSDSPNTTATNTVLGSGGPVSGGGNYLSVTVNPDQNDSEDARYALGRDFSAGIDQTSPYRIEFTLRIDEGVDSNSTTFSNYHDRYTIFEGVADQTTTNDSNSWSIFAHGGTGTHAHAGAVGQWAFYSGGNDDSFDGSDPLKMISTGIALTTGGVYEFTIDVFPNADPSLATWNATVDDGTDSFTETDMGYRADDGVKEYLYFSTKKSNALPASETDDVRAFSVDGIRISQLVLKAMIQPVTGEVVLFNDSGQSIEFADYQINSPAAALLPGNGNWNSLQDQNYDFNATGAGESWEEGGSSSALALAESNLLGSSTLNPGESLSIGNAYNTALSDSNMTITYLDLGVGGGVNGLVEFLKLGDMNADGDVDELDVPLFIQALTNRSAFEANPEATSLSADLIGDFDGNGLLDLGDIGLFSSAVAAATASGSSTAVPEPATCLLASLAFTGLAMGRRGRR